MRSVSYLSICSGLIVLVIALAAPFILEWQLAQSLAHYGSAELAPQLVSRELEVTRAARILSFILAIFAILAGILILRRRAVGQTILVLVSSAFIISAAYYFFSAERGEFIIGAAIRGVWWIFVLAYSFKKAKNSGPSWWNT